jgi:hypothetical protein
MGEPLQFPRGVRLLRDDEISAGHAEIRRRAALAPRITTGYSISWRAEGPFAAVLEANVHAPQLWKVFQALAEALMPTVAAPILGIKQEEAVKGPYTDRSEATAVFIPYVESLQHDGFLEFGITFQHRGRVEEIFVSSTKYLRIWTNQPDAARRVLHAQGIPEVPNLEFIDNYPRRSETLSVHGGDHFLYVFDCIQRDFADLPRR